MNCIFLDRTLGCSAAIFLSATTAFGQTAKLETSVQSTAGGTAQSSSFSVIATIGQTSPPGEASAGQFSLSSGFISTLDMAVSSNQPPNLLHTATISAQAGQLIPITANVTDDRGIRSVQLRYRRGGDPIFSSVAMNFISGTNYQAPIPASDVTSRGVEYFILATDVDSAQTRQPATGIFSVQIQVPSVAKPTTQPSGTVATAYRLISVPLQLDNPSATAALTNSLGSYDDTKWRLFGLDPTASQNPDSKTPYVEFRSGGDLSPGKSLFLIVADPGKTITIGATRSVRTDKEFSIPLQRGHNFIGTPFNFNLPVGKLRLKSGGTVALRAYNGSSSYPPVTEMQPWEGYYLANLNQNDTLFVNPNFSSSALAPNASKTNAGSWRLRLLASCAEARDDYNFAGLAPASNDHYDDNDLAEPPPIGDYVSLYFSHPEWQKALSRFSDDIRAAASTNQQWHFTVATNIPHEIVTLKFEGLKEIDPSLSIFVVDEALKFKQDLRENSAYQYQPPSIERTNEFSLVVGKDEFVSAQTAGVQGVPENFVLEQNFPNPFPANGIFDNPETAIRFGLPEQSVVTIKILDLAGREIATLLDKVELPPGRHQRLWNGRDAQGRPVGSGIYFYQMQIGNGVKKTMKLMVLR